MKKWVIIYCFFAGLTGFAQSTDLARLEYTYFPQSSSDNSFRRFKGLINFPIKLSENENYLIPGFQYNNINFKFEDDAPVLNIRELDRYQSFTFTLGYLFSINEKWRFGAQGGIKIASNFETNEVIKDDFLYTGAIFFIKTSEKDFPKPWRLILGLHYSTTSGMPFPLPVVNYNREFAPNWSFTLGVPKTNIKYFFNKKNAVQAFVTLDGFFANLQNNRNISVTNDIADSISMTILLAGTGYEFNFTDHLVFYFYGGHTLINDIRFRNINKDNVYDISRANSFYLRSGLKFQF